MLLFSKYIRIHIRICWYKSHENAIQNDIALLHEIAIQNEEPINIGSGAAMSISDLANKIKSVTGYEGKLHFDRSKPDGTPRKLINSKKI